jgi:hypothetical protein
MKIQIQRIGHSDDNYHHHKIDLCLMEGTIKGGIRPGKELDIQFSHLDAGQWHTTKVTRVEYKGESMILVHTKNSIYLVVKGWREN